MKLGKRSMALWFGVGVVTGLLLNNVLIAVFVGLGLGASLDQWQRKIDENSALD